MKIIRNGVLEKQDIHQYKCQICGCVYELDLCKEEVGVCPYCNSHVSYQVEFNGDVELNIEQEEKPKQPWEVYPEEFYSFKDGLDQSDEEIRKSIKVAIEHYKENDCGYAMCATGNLLIAIFQLDKDNIDDYQVIVTKNYSSLDSIELSEK